MDVNVSGINDLIQFNTLRTLLGSMYQVGFSAQTGSATGIVMPDNNLSIGQNSQFLTDSVAKQQALNLSALKLRNATTPLNATSLNSAFNLTAASAKSSNANAVTATTLANAAAGVFEVGVSQLAKGQTVAGAPAGALAPTGVTTANGYGQLEFNIKGNLQAVTFKLNGSETNQEAFSVIAAQINGRNIGVTASVTVNQAGDASLNLAGPTGAANTFTLTDTLGNAAVFTGIGSPANVTQNAQDSVFTVNGTGFTNTTNQPALAGKGLQLNLLQVTGSNPVDITVGSNSSEVTTAINNFVDAFNSTLSALSSGASLTAQSSATSLSMLAKANAANFQSIGIVVGASGNLTVDETQLQNSLANQPEVVKSAFNGKWSFAMEVQTVANNVINQSVFPSGSFNFADYYNSSYQSAFNMNNLIASNMGLFLNSFM